MPKASLLLVALVLALAGCGGSSESGPDPEPSGISSAQVSAQFETEAGRALEETEVEGESWEQLGYSLNPAPSVVARYGVFNVYVVEPGNDDAIRSLLSDKATRKPLEADERGIYWELDSQSKTWVAHTRYGRNVVLTWFSENARKRTDARWERLDEILSGLETTA